MRIIFLAVLGLATFFASEAVHAELILQTNFGSLADGAVTESALTAATSGGNWALINSRDSTGFAQIQTGGTKALLLDDNETSSDNGGTVTFARLFFDTPADIVEPTSSVSFNFRTAARRVGPNKQLGFKVRDSGGQLLARLDWNDSGTVLLNNNSIGTSNFQFLENWNASSSAVRDVELLFADGQVTANFGGLIATDSFINSSVTNINQLELTSEDSSTSARGVFLGDVSVNRVTAVPEPSTMVLAGLVGGSGLLLRRRKRDVASA